MTDPGRFRHRLVLEAPVETADGAGGVVRTYAAVMTLWAELTPIAARGDVMADARGATVAHRILIRMRDDVTTAHRFRLGARIFQVMTLRDEDDGRLLAVHAEERRE